MGAFQNREFGRNGEDRAASFLESHGFEILNRNYRYGKAGEIDIIARKGDLLVFVEVKSRRGECFGGPLYSINQSKKKTIRFIASHYLLSHPSLDTKAILCRFDMIAIDNAGIEWIEDIFRQ